MKSTLVCKGLEVDVTVMTGSWLVPGYDWMFEWLTDYFNFVW